MAAPAATPPKPQAAAPKLSAAEILEKFKSDATPRDINDLIKDRLGEPTDEGREGIRSFLEKRRPAWLQAK